MVFILLRECSMQTIMSCSMLFKQGDVQAMCNAMFGMSLKQCVGVSQSSVCKYSHVE